MIIGKKYSIKWIDTFGQNGWYTEQDLLEECKKNSDSIESIGFFVVENKNFIALSAMTHNYQKGNYGHPQFIPKGCIKKIKKLL